MDRNKLLTVLVLDISRNHVHWKSSVLNEARAPKAILHRRHVLPCSMEPARNSTGQRMATLVAIAPLQ